MKAKIGQDAWTLLGDAAGLPPGSVRAARVEGQELAIWRSQSGDFHAWDDRCVHRGTRLSLGFVRAEELVCPYHGWHYGAGGQCRLIPAHPEMTPPANLVVPHFQAVESEGLLWAALGAVDTPPPLLGEVAYCRALPLSDPQSPLDRLIFLPSALVGGGTWRHAPVPGDKDAISVNWSRDGSDEEVRVVYRQSHPAAGLTAIAAEVEGQVPETRLLALQVENEESALLHILTLGPGAAEPAQRLACARWAQRLRWFWENDNKDVESHRPWLPMEDCA